MSNDDGRSRGARLAAEQALIRIVHHYGGRPEFVVLGGLVPDLLCSGGPFIHAGTTDIDVQVDLEVACGAVNMRRLERALLNAEFEPDPKQVWRWVANGMAPKTVVKFELLADLDDQPSPATVTFDGCERLGAVNLRGTGFASRDIISHELRSIVEGFEQVVEINVSGLAGFLLSKTAAAKSRHKSKDWYDIAFVLLHNDQGGPERAANAVRVAFGGEIVGAIRTAIDDLAANFSSPSDQGPQAYVQQLIFDHEGLDAVLHAAEAVTAVQTFHRLVIE